jgi:2-polyprenyl-3-methyl-5-hydroxy-6-metoxy-1,4-benzoquinol methylase
MHLRNCRLCGSEDLPVFLDLGYTPPADDFLRPERLKEPETHYPLRVASCGECGFVQLDHVVDPVILYQNEYPYESSMTRTGVAHFQAFADAVVDGFGFVEGGLAVDVGSNVGVLLSGFKRRGMRVRGIEPAGNIAAIANGNGIPTLPEFFGAAAVAKVLAGDGKAKVVTCSNVFAHVHDLRAFMAAVDGLLDTDGIFVVEAPYLVYLLDNLEYDTIYHEHLSYLSIMPLARFFRSCGMDLFHVTQSSIHGGSIRMYVGRAGAHSVRDSVSEMIALETKREIHSLSTLSAFADRVAAHREELVWLLNSLRREGKRIAGVSAPAKGMTLLNYCGIGRETLEFLTEKSTLKIGRFAPGSHLPVVPDAALVESGVDYALLLAWNFKDEIMANLSEFKTKGGRFIVPVPKPVIV